MTHNKVLTHACRDELQGGWIYSWLFIHKKLREFNYWGQPCNFKLRVLTGYEFLDKASSYGGGSTKRKSAGVLRT